MQALDIFVVLRGIAFHFAELAYLSTSRDSYEMGIFPRLIRIGLPLKADGQPITSPWPRADARHRERGRIPGSRIKVNDACDVLILACPVCKCEHAIIFDDEGIHYEPGMEEHLRVNVEVV